MTDDWQDHAACRGLTSLFYTAEQHEPGSTIEQAKAVCLTQCPEWVRDACLEFAINNGEKFGVWGGKSERQRRAIRESRGIAELPARVTAVEVSPLKPAKFPPHHRPICGTYHGYTKHRNKFEDACADCKAANAAYQRRKEQLRKERESPPITGPLEMTWTGHNCTCGMPIVTDGTTVACAVCSARFTWDGTRLTRQTVATPLVRALDEMLYGKGK